MNQVVRICLDIVEGHFDRRDELVYLDEGIRTIGLNLTRLSGQLRAAIPRV